MSGFRFHIAEASLPFTSSKTLLHLNPFFPNPFPAFPIYGFDSITDFIHLQESPFPTTSCRRGLYLDNLSPRVADLELGVELLLKESEEEDRKYKWTTEIKDGENRLKKSYKWTAQIQPGKYRPIDRTYTVKVSSIESEEETNNETNKKDDKSKKKKSQKSKESSASEPSDHAATVLNQVFAKRMEKRKGKRRKDLSAQDAAIMIQLSFRDNLIRKSQSLRALRELAIAKANLKESRALFNNFSYRHRLSHNAEERQRFSKNITALLLTVDAIQGDDRMVRAAKKLMVDELEAMMETVDPHPIRKSWSPERRTFHGEMKGETAQAVQMLDQEASSYETFEACL